MTLGSGERVQSAHMMRKPSLSNAQRNGFWLLGRGNVGARFRAFHGHPTGTFNCRRWYCLIDFHQPTAGYFADRQEISPGPLVANSGCCSGTLDAAAVSLRTGSSQREASPFLVPPSVGFYILTPFSFLASVHALVRVASSSVPG